ncbi:MAG: hypothetical protein CH6_2411 [Candidatus Kapaibacterium sp.]|nr:MAG: hypothetical protein CH6_2411 [Candidatus Kapabacteria bacterium]
MKIAFFKTNVLVPFIIILIAVFLFLVFAWQISKISVIEDPFFGKNPRLKSKVEIYKNPNGIPHIIADDVNDAMFAVGFAQASDRLWQMDYMRRVAKGELAEILGPQAIKFDQYFRALRLTHYSEIVFKNLDSLSLHLLKAYSDGVNYFIETHNHRLPIEFQTLGYKPKPWTPLDCILIGRLMAFTMNFSFWMDLTYFDISNKIGLDKTLELVPVNVESMDFYLKDTNYIKHQKLDSVSSLSHKIETNFSSFVDYLQQFYPILYLNFGSNTWAVRSSFNQKNKAILASDPHLKLTLPPNWYQIHITTSKFNVVGLCLPGIPLPLIGRNDYIAWGITNGMIDDCDFWVHRIDSTGRFVLDSIVKTKILFKTDTIKVKNSSDFVYYQRYIGNDIIISDFLLLKDSSISNSFYGISNSPKVPETIGLTFKWTAMALSNEVLALYKISSAKNWNQFSDGLKHWGVPALNFSYADVNGNIGLILAGNVPIRTNFHPNFPINASNKSFNWVGFKKLSSEFFIFNPPEGFVLNCNNKTFSSSYHLSNLWSDPSRAFRVHNLLMKSKPEVALNIEVIQNDRYSEQANFVLKKILPVLDENASLLNSTEKLALNKLRNWNCIFNENFVAPSIYQYFLVKFLENVLKDDLGEPLFRQYLYLDFMANRMFLNFLTDSTSYFFGNSSKKDLIVKSFRDAVSFLRKKYTDNVENWTYGRWHKLKIEHPFSFVKLLDPSFSLEETPIGGHNTTINYAGGKLFMPEKIEVGPSARFIADMSDSVVHWILPGGNSGQNLSRNYSDQFQLWYSGSYISTSISKTPDQRFKLFARIEPR